MPSATHFTLQLARFDALRANEGLAQTDVPGPIFAGVAADTDFAYGPGIPSHQMGKQQDQHMADRISSTRHIILRSEGTWYGTDPSRPRPG